LGAVAVLFTAIDVREPWLGAVAVLFTAIVVKVPYLGAVAVLFTAIVVRMPCLGAIAVLFTAIAVWVRGLAGVTRVTSKKISPNRRDLSSNQFASISDVSSIRQLLWPFVLLLVK
jgi:hypothetical protein